jgi:hypothetical protein
MMNQIHCPNPISTGTMNRMMNNSSMKSNNPNTAFMSFIPYFQKHYFQICISNGIHFEVGNVFPQEY